MVVTIILGIYLFLAAGCIDIITMNHSPAANGRLAKKYNLASTTGDLYVIIICALACQIDSVSVNFN